MSATADTPAAVLDPEERLDLLLVLVTFPLVVRGTDEPGRGMARRRG